MSRLLQELGERDLKIAGFQLWVHGRQYPDSNECFDAIWLRVTAHTGASGAEVWVSGAILMVTDLAQWAQECDRLEKGAIHEAVLQPLEPELRVRIRPTGPLGHLAMRVEITPDHLTQSHSFDFAIDQSYLPSIVMRCRKIIKAYPVLGSTT